MTEIDAIKNAQRLYHIIQAIARIRRSVDGISKEDFFENEDKQGNVVRCIENDLSKLDEKARAILKELPLPKDFSAPQLP